MNLLSLDTQKVKTSIMNRQKNCFIDKKLRARKYEDAYIVPAYDVAQPCFERGALTRKGSIIQESLIFEGFGTDWSNSVDLSKAIKSQESVIYLGWLEPVWGHILTDCLKKMWFLKTKECEDLLKHNAKLVALTPWRSKPLLDVLKLLEIDTNSITFIKNITQFKTVYIPDNSIIRNENDQRFYTKEYKEIIRLIYSKIPVEPILGDKVYFTRTALAKSSFLKRRDFGEETIEKEFKKLGYKILSPEKLQVMESLKLLRNCSAFAATEGSISHNALFCRPGTPVTIIKKANIENPWQIMINQVAEVKVTYINANHSLSSTGVMGPFYLCVTKDLENFVGHRIPHIPHFLRPSFWWYSLQNRKIVKSYLSLLGL